MELLIIGLVEQVATPNAHCENMEQVLAVNFNSLLSSLSDIYRVSVFLWAEQEMCANRLFLPLLLQCLVASSGYCPLPVLLAIQRHFLFFSCISLSLEANE